LFTLLLAACRLSTDPDVHTYSCTTAADCGSGWECRPQFAGGSRCFKQGQCVDTESCNGLDDNCDGRVDETFSEQGQSCATGLLGACAAGARACQAGKIVCVQSAQPTVELCNGVDDDCNGKVDETFDLTSDGKNCGSCGRACVTGTACKASACKETSCEDLIDNDLNGLTDCADPSCLGATCGTALPPAGNCGLLPGDGGLGEPDAGPDAGWVRACYPRESNCSNAIDDDGDGLVDCLDPDCDGLTCMSGTVCTNRTCPGPG